MNKPYLLNYLKPILVLQIIFHFFYVSNLNAQTVSYSFSQVTGTSYSEITGGTILATATGTSTASSLDDIIYNLPSGTIPFPFIMNNASYTGCNISTNGFLTFGTIAPAANSYAPIASATAYDAAIALTAVNLNAYFYSGNTLQNGEIRYQTTGVAPNRCFVVQWKNFKPLAIVNSPFVNGVNGQIRLYETTNLIELIYKTTTAYTGITPQIGLRGINNTYPTNVNIRAVASAGSWIASTNGTSNAAVCSLNSTFPPSGLIYRFTPQCYPPTNLQIANIQKTSTQLIWSSLVSGTAKVEYGLSGFTLGTGTIVNNAISPLSVTGLTAGTNYQFYVTTNCTSGGTSLVTGPFSFTTVRIGDDCGTAPTITLFNGLPPAASFTTVTSGITADGPNALCSDITGNVADDDMWFKFVAPSVVGNKIVITTTAGTANDWVMQIWNGCPGSGSVLKCSDDVNAAMPEITLCQTEYTPGQIFYVRVWTYGQGVASNGNMKLCAYLATSQCVIPPINDECINAIALSIGTPSSCPGSSQSFSTNFATAAVSPYIIAAPTCGTGSILDEFFKFNTGMIGSFTLTLKAVSAPSIKASLLFDCGGQELQCFSPVSGGSTYTISGLNDLADYYIRVWSPSGQSGSFEICLADVCDDSKAVISGSNAICPSGTAQLKVDFTGIGPWNFTYTNGTSNFSASTSTTPYYFNVSPTVTTTYSLVSVSSQYCAGTVSGSAVITMLVPPTVTLAAFSPVCGNVSYSLSGGSPSGGAYSGQGVNGGIFNPALLNPGSYPIVYTYGVGSGCAQSATQPIQVLVAPSITSFNPGTGPIGSTVVIQGTNFTGASIVRFNTSNSTSYTIPSSTQISAIVPAGTTTGYIRIQLPNGCFTNSNTVFGIGTAPLFAILNIKAFIQGFYTVGGVMTAVIDPVNKATTTDSITVSLAQSFSPYAIVASVKTTINTSGIGAFAFSSSLAGSSYYIVIKHRNSIETWSANPILLSSGGTTFDFTVPR